VWLAYGAVIEPGTVVGNGCVVATLAVVSGVVPPDSLVAGNPAQVVPLESSRGPVTTVPGALAFEPRQAPADSETVRQAILVWFDDTRCFGDAAALITSDTMSLREAGLLDSLGVIQLIAVLEKRFRVAIDRERAAHPSAHTLRGFVECVLTAQPLDGTGSGDMFVAGAEDE
jgi:acyl carrier protein